MDATLNSGFDTLSAANDLEKAGFSREQAEVLSYTMARAQGDLATKADITVVKSDIAVVKADITAVKADIDAVRSEISSLRGVLFGAILPMLLANLGLTVAVLIHLLSA